MTAELVAACTGGAAITGWALHLGCGTGVVAVLGALPFVAQVLQVPAAWLTSRLGARRVALWAVTLSRQAFLPLVALPFVTVAPERARLLLLGVAAAHHGLGIVCNNGWVAWMGDLVPRRLRGRYFGRRTAICTVAAALSGLGAGALLERGGSPRTAGLALAALALTSCVVGAASTALMSLQHDPERRRRPRSPRWTALGEALSGAAPRRLALFLVASSLASGLATPFFAVYVLRERGLGFGVLSGLTVVAALARSASAPWWGRVVDRSGSRRVLVLSSALMMASPVLCLAAASPAGGWALALEAVLAGVATAGHGVAGLALPLAIAPRDDRAMYHAAFALAGALAFAAGTALGAAAAGAAAARSLAGPLLVAFGLSAVARLAAAGLALRLVEPAATGREAGEEGRRRGAGEHRHSP